MSINIKELTQKKNPLTEGHRMCPGCGAPTAIRQALMAVDNPVVPADAFAREIPASRFLNVASNHDALRRKFNEPDIIDPNFATFTKQPDTTFMN